MNNPLNKYLKIIDWYIIKKYLGTFVFTLVIFIVISVVFDISEHLDNFLSHHATIYDIAFKYYAGFIPFYINLLSPLINFLANKLKVTFENTHGFNGDPSKNEVHLQLDKRTFVYVQTYDPPSHTGYQFVLEKFDGDVLREKIVANTITYDSLKKTWSLRNYSIRRVSGLREKLDMNLPQKDTVLELSPSDFETHDNIYSAMSMSLLNSNIDKEKIRGSGNLRDMQYEKYKRFVYPLASFVLTLIGVSISSRKVRGGIGLPLGIGLFLCFAYIVVDKFALVFAIKSGLPPLIAVCLPNGLFGILGCYLLYKAPK